MSASGQQHPAFGAAQPSAGADPSMEDILASIRRILSEDETPVTSKAPDMPAPPQAAEPFALDESMLIREPPTPPPVPAHVASPLEALGSFMTAPTQPDIAAPQVARQPPVEPEPKPEPVVVPIPEPPETAAIATAPAAPPERAPPEHLAERHAERLAAERAISAPLVGPEASAAASASMGTLLRTLTTDRQPAVYRGGPTLEDMMREEMRPMLKQWLDANLPTMVERLVRSEIERVSGRATV